MRRIVILAGSAEANQLCSLLLTKAAARYAVTMSLAGQTSEPRLLGCQYRYGGFGGVAGLRRYLSAHADIVVDATHPYAQRISVHAAVACRALAMPRIAVYRPPWRAAAGDDWTTVADIPAVVAYLRKRICPQDCVFLSLGRRAVPLFQTLHCRFLIRSIDAAVGTPARCHLLSARGPFDVFSERVLFYRYGVTYVVSRNSGGFSTRAKIDAARLAAIPVIMIAAAAPPPPPYVSSAEQAFHDVEHHGAMHTLSGCRNA